MRGFVSYIRDSIAELRSVVWPSRSDVIRHTAVIIVSVAISMLIIAIVDFGLSSLVDLYVLK